MTLPEAIPKDRADGLRWGGVSSIDVRQFCFPRCVLASHCALMCCSLVHFSSARSDSAICCRQGLIHLLAYFITDYYKRSYCHISGSQPQVSADGLHGWTCCAWYRASAPYRSVREEFVVSFIHLSLRCNSYTQPGHSLYKGAFANHPAPGEVIKDCLRHASRLTCVSRAPSSLSQAAAWLSTWPY